MRKTYLCTWAANEGGPLAGISDIKPVIQVETLSYPPHEEPKGSTLTEMLEDAIASRARPHVVDVVLLSAFELPSDSWWQDYAAVCGQSGIVRSVFSHGQGWQVI